MAAKNDISGHLIKKVDMTINQDWFKVRNAYDLIYNKIINGELDKYSYDHGYSIADNSKAYDLSNFGSVELTKGWSEKDWLFWQGQYFYSLLPWYKQAKEYFKDLEFESIMWVVSYDTIREHIDLKHISDVNTPDDPPQCKLTYIVSSQDPDAYTIARDVKNSEIFATYQSIPDTAWLLHTGHIHGVYANSGLREVLQFKFNRTYDEVCAYLDKIGPIILE